MTLQQVLESYSEITLTDDEMLEGMIWAKRRKADFLRTEQFKKFEEENRKLRAMKWNFTIIQTFMFNKAKRISKDQFILDEHNRDFFDLLCYYFIADEERFTTKAKTMGVEFPSIKKGLLIPGVYGCGKTWMMQLFSRQTRLSFEVVRAKVISQEFLEATDKKIPEVYMRPYRCNWDEEQMPSDVNYPSDEVFNQKLLGLCIDDLGSEGVKNSYGNKSNVIGDIIEARYAAGYTGVFLHGTTNLTADQLKEFYGGRVASRMKEIFNWIVLPGEDRRK